MQFQTDSGLIKLRGNAGWFETKQDAHVVLKEIPFPGSYDMFLVRYHYVSIAELIRNHSENRIYSKYSDTLTPYHTDPTFEYVQFTTCLNCCMNDKLCRPWSDTAGVYTVCSALSVRILRVNTVKHFEHFDIFIYSCNLLVYQHDLSERF